jgi:hypothetical protein
MAMEAISLQFTTRSGVITVTKPVSWEKMWVTCSTSMGPLMSL